MSAVAVTREEYGVWSRYVYEISGIHLDQTKTYLLETRLGSMLQETGASNFTELYYKTKTDLTKKLRRQVIDSITTNETSFFRDTSPFELMQHKLLPELVDRRNKSGLRPVPIRIWSAACSSGQEVYSTAITIKELLGDMRSYDARIIGTDISDKMIAQASYGHFSRLELERGMSADKLSKYFEKVGDRWKVRDEIRAMSSFRTINLLEPFAFPSKFDIILCRNVAIYFTESDKIRMFRNIGKCLAGDGCLIVGSTESITGLCPEYEPKRYLRAVFYQLKASQGVRT
jgi:chemotaxis protein methyltransferase CheR